MIRAAGHRRANAIREAHPGARLCVGCRPRGRMPTSSVLSLTTCSDRSQRQHMRYPTLFLSFRQLCRAREQLSFVSYRFAVKPPSGDWPPEADSCGIRHQSPGLGCTQSPALLKECDWRQRRQLWQVDFSWHTALVLSVKHCWPVSHELSPPGTKILSESGRILGVPNMHTIQFSEVSMQFLLSCCDNMTLWNQPWSRFSAFISD